MSGRREWLCYTDGACKAAHGGAGGWGFHLVPPDGGAAVEGSGHTTGTLAKVMEYRAVAEAVAALPDEARAIVFSDNESLVQNLGKKLADWRASELRKVDPQIVESVRRIATLVDEKRLSVRFEWVRSHRGNAGNERADFLAREAARAAKVTSGSS